MAGRPRTVAPISSLQLIVNHFMSALLSEAKHDIDVAQAIVNGRSKTAGAVETAAGAATRKRDRTVEKARAKANREAAAAGQPVAEGEAPKRRRGRPAKGTNGQAGQPTTASEPTAVAEDVSIQALPDPGGPMGDDVTA